MIIDSFLELVVFLTVALPSIILFFTVFLVGPMIALSLVYLAIFYFIGLVIFRYVIKPISKMIRGDNYE